ncbi:hypothetical protein B0H66DRAFT_197503 [Apodospora peruviana]|uniref:TPR-like protein n=1 Tax=Apodospora peruviana TaxID=516989 RepID=A0AAE0IBX6_9PEZI|nr:hypothetical protein B0H66DRAFT_197503 [Apodospora peruviana]
MADADEMDIDPHPPALVAGENGIYQHDTIRGGDSAAAAAAAAGPGGAPLYEDDIYAEVEDDDDDDEDDVTSEVSDADSDELELRANTARFDAQKEAFVAEQRGSDAAAASGMSVQFPPADPTKTTMATATTTATSAAVAGGGGKAAAARPRRKLGPRKAARPTPDILFRLSLASDAYDHKDYEGTITMLSEIIRINSETHAAWTLLSNVHEDLGDREKATMCRMTAAHLVPKNVAYWITTAVYALDGVEDMEDGPEKQAALDRALTCYSQALVADKRNIEARTGKADVLMMQGHSSLALAQYQRALEFRPLNIRTVRNMADVALDAKDPRRTCESAKAAYRRVIDHLQTAGTFEAEEGRFAWSDLRIYLEFFAVFEQWQAAAQELKQISRWMLGRRDELYWDHWLDDDREWDLHDDRRIMVPEYVPTRFPQDSYGQGLPVDLRAKLYVYRHKQGNEYEAAMHLRLLDPTTETAVDDFMDFPDCLKDIGNALLEGEKADQALLYFQLYRRIADAADGDIVVDADVLVSQGRCHIALGDKAAAEECFIAAIEADEDNIDARVQLANMYEGEQQQEGREEAFLLVREAMNLEAKKQNETAPGKRRGPYKPRKPRDPNKPKKERPPKPPGERRLPRRLINAEKRKQQDIEMTEVASKNYQVMQELRDQVYSSGSDEQTKAAWMRAAKGLVDDFRSYKQFYPWEKYIKYLGYGGNVQGQASLPARNMKLAAMAERLQQNLAPAEGEEQGTTVAAARVVPQMHRGIPFNKWLDIFLDYAFCLVRAGQRREAYVVCHAARDSTVWMATDTTFLIHLAWASCAVYAGDEETCVAIARYFMRDYMPGTDSYRMFSAMCRVCQTPVSWYTSGPAQKFILRQIKTMDNIIMKKMKKEAEMADGGNENGHDQIVATSGDSDNDDGIALDVCLLTIYGHILFTTTSYTYALSYLARAASMDPHNCLINLSMGLAYLHYALKRQATNRQYLLTQAFAFLFRYYRDRLEGEVSRAQRQEAHFNMARAYSLIGLGNLANDYYTRVLDEVAEVGEESDESKMVKGMGNEDLTIEAAYNIRTMCFLLGDLEGAKAVAERWLVL